MFVELLPLLRNRTVSLSVAVPANGDSIVLTIMPKVTDEKAEEFGSIKEAAVKALSGALTLKAQSAEELDAGLHQALLQYVGSQLTIEGSINEMVKTVKAAGGMLSFELDAPHESAIAVLNSVELCSRAESLGGLETLITHPASTTHADLGPETRAALGISEGLIRISVGLESPADIIVDLAQAFAAAGCASRAEEAASEIR